MKNTNERKRGAAVGSSVLLCAGCGRQEELRLGYCFDCASNGELRAAKRTVWQHFITGAKKLHQRKRWWQIRYDWRWAWQRLTRTGDYRDGGTFDREGYDWRSA